MSRFVVALLLVAGLSTGLAMPASAAEADIPCAACLAVQTPEMAELSADLPLALQGVDCLADCVCGSCPCCEDVCTCAEACACVEDCVCCDGCDG